MYTVDENVNWCSDCGKEYGGFSKINLKKTELPYDPAIPLLGIYLKKTKTLTRKDTHTPMFTAGYLQLPRYGSNLSAHQHING